MSRPIAPFCVAHQCFMRVVDNGTTVVTVRVDDSTPYEIWRGDEWRCDRGAHSVVVGWADRASARDGDPAFAANVDRAEHREVPTLSQRVERERLAAAAAREVRRDGR